MTTNGGARRERCRVLIFVPNVTRDLEGHALVAYHLRTRFGHDVAFCGVDDIERTLLSWAPDVMVFDRIDTRIRLSRLARRLGCKVVLLPTVGFVQEGVEIEARRAGKYVQGERILDLCFTWGPRARALLLEQTALSPEQVQVTGCTRFDCYAEPYLSLIEPKEHFLRRFGFERPSAPLVVWSTNTFHERTRDLKGTVAGAVASGVPEGEIRGQLEDEGTAFHDLARFVSALAAAHPEWNVAVKMHPSELVAPYRELAARAPNIRIVSDVPIRDVLHHCDVLLANCSTTATEAWMLGKPVLEVAFGHYNVPLPPEYLAGNEVVTTVAEGMAAVERCIADPAGAIGASRREVRDAFLSNLYYRIDGRAAERSAEWIDRLLAPERHGAEAQARLRAAAAEGYAAFARARARRPANRVRRLAGLPPELSLRFWRPQFWRRLAGREVTPPWARPITPELVEEMYARFARALGAAPAGGAGGDAPPPARRAAAGA